MSWTSGLWTRFAGKAPDADPDAGLRRELVAVNRNLDRISKSLDRLAAVRKQDAKWKRIFRDTDGVDEQGLPLVDV